MIDYYYTKTREPFIETGQFLSSGDLRFPVENILGFRVPIFKRQIADLNEFSRVDAAAIHDNALKWLHEVHGSSEDWLRLKLVSEIPQVNNDPLKILVTSCGAGNDLRYLLSRYSNAKFFVQDIAQEMLQAAIARNLDIVGQSQFNFSVCDACELPFGDDTFDIVFHFGGINLFADVKKGIEEMHRVAKVGGAVLFGDEGIAPYLYNDEISKVLIKNNSLYASRCPYHFIPPFVDNFKLQYLFNNCFYLVTYNKGIAPNIDVDVVHAGKRGGSLRTRYFGQLEGVDPELRDRIFEKAAQAGVSRVEFIESVLRAELSK